VLETAGSFWKSVSKDRFPKLKDFALKMHLAFGNRHVCESKFSTMKQVKSKNRSWMADETLVDSLRLSPLRLVLRWLKNDSVREASTTGIPLIEICNKLLFGIA